MKRSASLRAQAGIAIDWIDAAGAAAPRRDRSVARAFSARSGCPAASDGRDRGKPRAPAPVAIGDARTFVTATVGEPIASGRSCRSTGTRRRVVARDWRDEGDHGPRHAAARRSRRRSRARLSSPARCEPRDHARGRADALPDARRCRAGREAVGACGAALRAAASRRRWRSAIPARSRDLVKSAAREARTRSRSARRTPVRRRPIALRTLFAVEPAVPQSAVSPIRPCCSAQRASPPRAAPQATPGPRARRIDRLAGRGARKIRAAAPAVRRFRRRTVEPFAADFAVLSFVQGRRSPARARAVRGAASALVRRDRSRNGAGATGPPNGATPTAPASRLRRRRAPRDRLPPVPAMDRRAQLRGACSSDARDAGMRIGLIADLAVGMSPRRQPRLVAPAGPAARPERRRAARSVQHARAGLGPDGVLAARAVASGFEPFLATLRAAMRHAGGVRIDHAMGLTRLWLVPEGASPD